MKLITLRGVIKTVAERWDKQYVGGPYRVDEHKLDISKQLNQLNLAKATKTEVDKTIGNTTWTDIKCDECGKIVETVALIGEELTYESATACICLKCVEDVQYLIMEGNNETNSIRR